MVVAGKSSATLLVGEIMTPEGVLKTVTSGDTVLAAMELMIDNNFRHVPVVRALSAKPYARGVYPRAVSSGSAFAECRVEGRLPPPSLATNRQG